MCTVVAPAAGPSSGVTVLTTGTGPQGAVLVAQPLTQVQHELSHLLVILLAPPVAGQTPTASSPSRQSIELMVGHGRVLHLDEPAESVYVGDTAIADLRIVAPDVVYVIRIAAINEDVSGLERHEIADMRHELCDREDHVAGMSILMADAVDLEP